MEKIIKYSKKAFSNTIELGNENGVNIGFLKFHSFKSNVIAKIYEMPTIRKFEYTTKDNLGHSMVQKKILNT